jgi:predicted PurR-regulated permease PerM
MWNQIGKTIKYFVVFNFMSFTILYLIRIFENSTKNLVTQIILASLIPALTSILYYLIRHRKRPNSNQYYKYLSGFLLAFILLSWSVINIERSRSFQVLRSIHTNEISSQSKLNQLPILVSDQKERNHNAILSRLKEQVDDGNARCEDDQIYLTKVGNFIQSMSAQIAKYYKLEGYFEIDEIDQKAPIIPIEIDCRYFE